MTKDSGSNSSRKPLNRRLPRSKKPFPREMNFPDASHPIFSRPTIVVFKNNPTPPAAEPEKSSEASEEAQPPSRYPKHKPVPMKFRDASDPIYSNPTVITFVRAKRSSPDSEIPEPGKPTSPEDSVGTED